MPRNEGFFSKVLGRKEGSLVKMGAAEASGTGKKDCGVSWGKLDMYK
jgi:hypothetical protein